MAIDKIQSESINLADTFAFTGTVTGAGESNLPYFSAYITSNQTGITNDTQTKMAMDNVLQNGSDYNTSTYRFTPTTAGKFYLYSVVHLVSLDNTLSGISANIRKNGSMIIPGATFSTEGMSERFRQLISSTSIISSANGSSDYFEFYFNLTVSSGSNYYLGTGSTTGGFLVSTT
tara:strand:- start:29 stop:553 length:525 start_codon:yes stop_codon:yes gene_type:complete